MSGDWIKVEKSTPTKPEIMNMADTLGLEMDDVFGKVFRLWCWFDEQTKDGNAASVTDVTVKRYLDRYIGVNGFCEALIKVGWMAEKEGCLMLPNFDRHNGKTAKERALTAKRVEKHREKSCNGNVTLAPLPEKRREEVKEKIVRKPRNTTQKAFIPPTLEEVQEYARSRNSHVDAKTFHEFYEAGGWKDSKGKKVASWKQKFLTWERHQEKPAHANVEWDSHAADYERAKMKRILGR